MISDANFPAKVNLDELPMYTCLTNVVNTSIETFESSVYSSETCTNFAGLIYPTSFANSDDTTNRNQNESEMPLISLFTSSERTPTLTKASSKSKNTSSCNDLMDTEKKLDHVQSKVKISIDNMIPTLEDARILKATSRHKTMSLSTQPSTDDSSSQEKDTSVLLSATRYAQLLEQEKELAKIKQQTFLAPKPFNENENTFDYSFESDSENFSFFLDNHSSSTPKKNKTDFKVPCPIYPAKPRNPILVAREAKFSTKPMIDLRQHLSIDKEDSLLSEVYDSPKVQCDFCGRIFSIKKQLIQHMKIHSSKRASVACDILTYTCLHCNYQTKTSSNLNRHMKFHLARGYPYCDILYCRQKFSSLEEYEEHKKIHIGTKIYKCIYCNYQCNNARRSNTHMKAHLARGYPYCDILYCRQKFSSLEEYEEHKKIHIGTKIYKCLHCNFQTKVVWSFGRHMKRRHPIT